MANNEVSTPIATTEVSTPMATTNPISSPYRHYTVAKEIRNLVKSDIKPMKETINEISSDVSDIYDDIGSIKSNLNRMESNNRNHIIARNMSGTGVEIIVGSFMIASANYFISWMFSGSNDEMKRAQTHSKYIAVGGGLLGSGLIAASWFIPK